MAASYFSEDTIAAIATGQNEFSGVGIVRISGKDALSIALKLVRTVKGASLDRKKVQSHRISHAQVVDASGAQIDDGMFVWMQGPKSFTGEDVVELHLHGNPLILKRVVRELLVSGAREALPGEFSFRAFRNGKITLDQAESISDLVKAKTPASVERSLNILQGSNKRPLLELRAELIGALAEIEVEIDFADQGLSSLNYEAWAQRLISWCNRVEEMREAFLRSTPLREGIHVSLIGKPNSGKSSIFNALLETDRSIISTEAGTTRDVVRETMWYDGMIFELADTAGIRSTENQIEALGIKKSFDEVRDSSVTAWVFDGDEDFDASEAEALHRSIQEHLDQSAHLLAIWNKIDLGDAPRGWIDFCRQNHIPFVAASAQTGVGISDIKNTIKGFFKVEAHSSGSFLIGRARHFEVIGRAQAAVRGAVDKVNAKELLPDLLASDLREAVSALGEISGEFTTDDLLQHIFSEFCIGK